MPDDATKLLTEGILSETSYERIKAHEKAPFSLHWELRTLLYLGVLLFSGGLGLLVYLHIDTIGHQAVLAFIGLACVGCMGYCFKKGLPFSPEKHVHESPFFDYILLLGCLLFLTFEGYLQYQYQVFRVQYDLAALIPAFLFFYLAYRFDHVGILSMAISALTAWAGISITPLDLWESFDDATGRIIGTGIGLGVALAAIGWALEQRKLKSHFFFTYANFATHLLFVSTLTGMFVSDDAIPFPWFFLLLLLFVASFYLARKERSFYFLLVALLYGYVGLTYFFFCFLDGYWDATLWIGLFYFIGSCAGIVYFLRHHKTIVSRLFSSLPTASNEHSI